MTVIEKNISHGGEPLATFSLLLTDGGLWRLDPTDGENLQFAGVTAVDMTAALTGLLAHNDMD